MTTVDADVIIVGAGLSGVGAACHLREHCPDRSVLIIEGRESMGGTWDLFRYPGIRSDSDMHTLGYNFRPWREAKAIADGPSILNYIRHTAKDYDIEALIRYSHWLKAADWDSGNGCWTLTVHDVAENATRILRSRFLLMCAGYYSYRQGYQPEFPGREAFRGDFIHPQFWPEAFDARDKRIVVIGSGATAMTLVPELAKSAAEVVMLQRSPTYVISRPARDRLANLLRRLLPETWAYALTRWKNTRMQQWLYHRSRKTPAQLKKYLIGQVRKAVGDKVDVDRHFTPSYNPWDQRLCLVPDGDLFEALRSGHARVVTDRNSASQRARCRTRVGRLPGSGRHRLGYRAGSGGDGRGGIQCRRRARGFRPHLDLQGHYVQRCAEYGVCVRLHQRFMDAARGPDCRVVLSAAQPHARQTGRCRRTEGAGGIGNNAGSRLDRRFFRRLHAPGHAPFPAAG